ncbi:hypothetical protein L7F22_022732 [Adiantum nelumboides]|nr:hypothetical protein [Adiantum nelumboides]
MSLFSPILFPPGLVSSHVLRRSWIASALPLPFTGRLTTSTVIRSPSSNYGELCKRREERSSFRPESSPQQEALDRIKKELEEIKSQQESRTEFTPSTSEVKQSSISSKETQQDPMISDIDGAFLEVIADPHGVTVPKLEFAPRKKLFAENILKNTFQQAVQKLLDDEFPGVKHIQTSTLHKKVSTARHGFIKLAATENKLESLLQVLEPSLAKKERVMVFCNTLNSCRAVDHYLNENDILTVNYHGAVPADERFSSLPTRLLPLCL